MANLSDIVDAIEQQQHHVMPVAPSPIPLRSAMSDGHRFVVSQATNDDIDDSKLLEDIFFIK